MLKLLRKKQHTRIKTQKLKLLHKNTHRKKTNGKMAVELHLVSRKEVIDCAS